MLKVKLTLINEENTSGSSLIVFVEESEIVKFCNAVKLKKYVINYIKKI